MAERKPFLMRIDPALWRELERWAADDLRSINGQVEFILRDALRRRGMRIGDHDGAPGGDGPGASTGTGTSPGTMDPEEPR